MSFKVGDIVICKPGFNASDMNRLGLPKGGYGYKKGFVFKINHITESDINCILWPSTGASGVHAQAVELYAWTMLTKREKKTLKKLNPELEL